MSIVGLRSSEAAELLSRHGPNELQRAERTPAWELLLEQVKTPVVLLLVVAAGVSALLGEWMDSTAIVTIVLLNAVIGYFQEARAERAILALRSMTARRARVVRDGQTVVIPSSEVVAGDVLVLEEGDLVAADGRVVEANDLSTNEAALTGESLPVEKSTKPTAENAHLAERSDRVFLGTAVVAGSGRAVVVATGMHTEVGRIAGLLVHAREEYTPLQRRLLSASRSLITGCAVVVVIVAVLGLVRGDGWLNVFLTSVSLAVAAVPEGLPAIVTIALAIGVQRMAMRNVLVRKLPAVETLGCATVICTDKTGTLTRGVMAVREIWSKNRRSLLDAAAACSDAVLAPGGIGGIGDPTEIAILEAAAQEGIARSEIERARPRVKIHPFRSDRKRMSILRANGTLYLKGAMEVVLERCIAGADGAREANAEMAARGLRVLAVAVGTRDDETELRLLGLVGLADPPRSDAIEAVATARRAGIRIMMITGDHPATALAIAREMGVFRDGDVLADVVRARATAAEKLEIVRQWKERGEIVAMTGDGVNDAPAIREAHVGIAMGKGGTEVTREASDLVLADDNFASIIAAVCEGRGIYDNIRKTLVYLLAGNTGELLVMLGAAVAGYDSPLLPLQLLWINLATDGLPALALVMDPADPRGLERPPRRPSEPLIGAREWSNIAITGFLQAATSLSAFAWALSNRDLREARNIAFSTLVFGELFRAFAVRSDTHTFWETAPLENFRLLVVVIGSAAFQIAIHHVPILQELFGISPISLGDCVLSVALGLIPVTALELSKLVRRTL